MDSPFSYGTGCVKLEFSPLTERRSAMKITTIGLDIAKNVVQIHGVNKKGKAVYLFWLRHF
jgi:hypothetical protein